MTTPTPYFKRDSQLRARLFDARSFEHDAKANLNLLDYLVDHYTQPGNIILDPMGGTGSMYIGASVRGRQVLCGELETWLMPILNSNRRRAAAWARFDPLAYQGDAAKLPFGSGSVNHIITSPPYWDTFSDWHVTSQRLKNKHRGPNGSAYADERGSKVKRNCGNEHVYEAFLRRMAPIYLECRRVLVPGGRLVLIVKDKIHKGLRVPIVTDFCTMLVALGYQIVTVLTRAAPLTLYRNIHLSRGLPVIYDEQVIVAEAPLLAVDPYSRLRYTIVFPPDVDHGPPQQVYQWSIQAAKGGTFAWTPQAELMRVDDAPTWRVDPWAHAKFTYRKRAAFEVAEWLVMRHGLRAGDHVALFVPWRYAAYLQRRLTTFGAVVDVPTKGLNMGQKMTKLKEMLNAR